MDDYADTISENIEKIANELKHLNKNLEVLNLISISQSDTLKSNNYNVIAQLRIKYKEILELLKN